MDEIMVSVICNVYNHEHYVRQMLESVVTQKTYFPFEVLVHDDASTDNSAEIIREFERNYPEIIKPIYQTENQYSKKIGIGKTFQYPRAKGKYIAFCEGDDYWTDPNKLQKQYDALESHPGIDICAHKGLRVKDGKTIGFVAPANHDCIFSVEQVILGGGGFVVTNSLMIRKEVMLDQTPMIEIISFDYVIQIQGSLRGGMLYLSDCMSAYRVQTPGSWTVRMSNNADKMAGHRKRVIAMLRALDNYTEQKYSSVINTHIKGIQLDDMERNHDYKTMLSKEYKAAMKLRSCKYRTRIRCLYILSRFGGHH